MSGRRPVNGRRATSAGGAKWRPNIPCVPFDRSPPFGCDERSGERGSATLWTVGGIAVIGAVLVGMLWFAAAVTARHRAEAAADLAALAAASTAVAGEQLACDEARWVTDQMGVALVSCRLSGWDAMVVVAAEPSGVQGEFGPAVARARAGLVQLER